MDLPFRQKIGKPRFDPSQKLLSRFYEPLILLRILDKTRGAQDYYRPASDSTSDDEQEVHHKFLDHLSWLCDYETGGDTVSAIAIQFTPSAPIYWLAANKNPKGKAESHLRWVLKHLDDAFHYTPLQISELEKKIVVKCIEFSKNRVRNYSNRLCNLIDKSAKLLEGSTDSDKSLHEDLLRLQKLRGNHEELCALAYSFRHTKSLDLLSDKISMSGQDSEWSNMRHYIGRLGSWTKASKISVRVAQKYPLWIGSFEVKCLVPPAPVPLPAPDSQTNVYGALRRMFPAGSDNLVQECQVALNEYPVENIPQRFIEEYTSNKPRVHAELLVLEHFFHFDFDFVGNRYIGCSKGSCYCCDLYMKFHPGNFVLRPCHGNLWKNWQAPIAPINEELGPHTYTAQRRAGKKHTDDILNDMIKRIRRDVIDQIKSKALRKPSAFDSTTNTSIEILGSVRAAAAHIPLDGSITPHQWSMANARGIGSLPPPISPSARTTPKLAAKSVAGKSNVLLKMAVTHNTHQDLSTRFEALSVEGNQGSGEAGVGSEDSDEETVTFQGRNGKSPDRTVRGRKEE